MGKGTGWFFCKREDYFYAYLTFLPPYIYPSHCFECGVIKLYALSEIIPWCRIVFSRYYMQNDGNPDAASDLPSVSVKRQRPQVIGVVVPKTLGRW